MMPSTSFIFDLLLTFFGSLIRAANSNVSCTVKFGNRISSCITYATSALYDLLRSLPLTSTSPDSSPPNSKRPASALISVVLPHPVGPITATKRPAGTDADTLSRMTFFSTVPVPPQHLDNVERLPIGMEYVRFENDMLTLTFLLIKYIKSSSKSNIELPRRLPRDA